MEVGISREYTAGRHNIMVVRLSCDTSLGNVYPE